MFQLFIQIFLNSYNILVVSKNYCEKSQIKLFICWYVDKKII